MPQPKLLSKPWASDGLKNNIPSERNGGLAQEAATYAEGFPSITMTPISVGGKPPSGKDMNGILHEISAHTVWQNQGGRYRFDQAFCDKIGGYPKGAVLINDTLDTEYISLADANTHNPNSGNNTGKWAVHAGKGLKASDKQAGITKVINTLTSTDTDAALTAAMGKKLNDEKLGNSGDQTITDGTLTLGRSNIWTKIIMPAGRGRWIVETNPQGSAAFDDSIRLNLKFEESGNPTRYISFPSINARNEIVAYQSWVNGQIADKAAAYVLLDGAQTVMGAKTFAVKSTHTGGMTFGGKAGEINTDADGTYIKNAASNKTLQLRDNGQLTYSDTKIILEPDLTAAINRAVTAAKAAVLAGAPTALDTLKELADALGNDGNFAANVTRRLGEASPSGQIAFFAGRNAPAGWLKANGAAVSRTAYAALFAAIGTTYGAGNGSTTFKLPDLRGEFVRGWDDGRGIDTGRALGSAQADEFKAHRHKTYSSTEFAAADGEIWARQVSNSGQYHDGKAYYTSSDGGGETRPRNIALLACIKI